MQTYRCHKKVRAAKITKLVNLNGTDHLLLDDGSYVPVDKAWFGRNPGCHLGGYFVEYEDGYTAFSPAGPFESGYTPLSHQRVGLTFGEALEELKAGRRVARAGWNGKGMWLALSPGSASLPAEKFWAGPNREYANKNGGAADVLPCITMKTATGEILMGWLASQTDMLASDWEVVG